MKTCLHKKNVSVPARNRFGEGRARNRDHKREENVTVTRDCVRKRPEKRVRQVPRKPRLVGGVKGHN